MTQLDPAAMKLYGAVLVLCVTRPLVTRAWSHPNTWAEDAALGREGGEGRGHVTCCLYRRHSLRLLIGTQHLADLIFIIFSFFID